MIHRLKTKILDQGIILKIRIGRIFRPVFQERTTPNEDFLKKGKSVDELAEEGRKAREKNAP